jgi:hypothetical protein
MIRAFAALSLGKTRKLEYEERFDFIYTCNVKYMG